MLAGEGRSRLSERFVSRASNLAFADRVRPPAPRSVSRTQRIRCDRERMRARRPLVRVSTWPTPKPLLHLCAAIPGGHDLAVRPVQRQPIRAATRQALELAGATDVVPLAAFLRRTPVGPIDVSVGIQA